AGHDHVEIATLLLEKGADAGIVDKSGETPLHLAAMVDGATVAALLIQKGADPNVQDGEGFTPLFLAATIGQPRVAAALLDGGADPNVGAEVAGITITPLDMAMKNGHSQVAELIAARGGRTSR
ncbi:MAG: ankyrin repeat domain-containing protein, partial [Armatimonadetes bacterium]|nr:ankyrin repeat domain-containing protein [Armatimonadota bacterium]